MPYGYTEAHTCETTKITQLSENVVELTTNKSNWSGENVTVTVNTETWTWELYDYSWSLTERVEEDKFGEHEWDLTLYELNGEGWSEPLTKVGFFARDKHKPSKLDAVAAFVKYICNHV